MNFVLNYLWIIFPLLNLRPKTCPWVGSYIYSVSLRKESAWALLSNGYSEPSDIRIWYPPNNTPEISPLLSPGSTAAGETSASSCSGSLPSVLCPIQTWDSDSGFLSVLPRTLRFYLWLVPWHPLNKLLLFLGFLVLTLTLTLTLSPTRTHVGLSRAPPPHLVTPSTALWAGYHHPSLHKSWAGNLSGFTKSPEWTLSVYQALR